MVTIPIWVVTLFVTIFISGLGAAFALVKSYSQMQVILAKLEASSQALHARVDELELMIARSDINKLSMRIDRIDDILSKIDKDVAILNDRRPTPVEGVPIQTPYPPRGRR